MDKKIAGIVYDLLTGEEFPSPELPIVENMFADGRTCEELYHGVYEANLRLCARLGVQEDPDVELIVDSLLRISRLLGLKMFHYGIRFQAGELES